MDKPSLTPEQYDAQISALVESNRRLAGRIDAQRRIINALESAGSDLGAALGLERHRTDQIVFALSKSLEAQGLSGFRLEIDRSKGTATVMRKAQES